MKEKVEQRNGVKKKRIGEESMKIVARLIRTHA